MPVHGMVRIKGMSRKMKRLKLRTRFFLYHTGIILLITIGLVGYICKVVVGEMKVEDEQHFQLISQKTTAQADSFFYNMDHTAMQIAMNPQIVEIFANIPRGSKENYFKLNPQEGKKIEEILRTYDLSDLEDSRILLYNRQQDAYWFSDKASGSGDIRELFEEGTFAEVRHYFSQGGHNAFFRSPITNGLKSEKGWEYFAVIRPIGNFSSQEQYGFIEVWEPVTKLEEIMSDIGEENYADILDEEGKVIYTSTGKAMSIDYGNVYWLEQTLEHAPYKLEFYKRPLRLEQELSQFYLMMFFTVIVIIAVVLSWERVMFRYFLKPLQALDGSMKSVAIDNLSVKIADEDSEDIIISLERSFNRMLKQLKSSMQRQIAAKTNETKAQLFALQSQMNPHFLHNILAIVSMDAQLDGNRKIPYICKKLGDILRYTSEMEDGFSDIQTECENSKNYMLLMQVRYEELFEYEIRIEEGAGEIKVPKLIVQPFCENCFKYGFKGVEPIWKIFIHAWVHEGEWYILIRDNGEGFQEEFLKEFNEFTKELSKKEVKDILNSISIGGLSIPNIYTRMKLTYGSEFTFELRNEKQGASVLLGGRCQ